MILEMIAGARMWGQAVQVWNVFWGDFSAGLPVALQLFLQIAENPWARALGLLVIVYLTIRVIAVVYSGDKQGAELGPVSIRAHGPGRYNGSTIRLPHELMQMSMDGVSADCRVYYAYTDANGKRRRQLVHKQRAMRLSISPSVIRRSPTKIDGQEIPDVPTDRVCFPPFEMQEPVEPVPPTPARARDYAKLHKILEQWVDDDAAVTISVGSDFMEDTAGNKDLFILDRIARIDRADRSFLGRRFSRRYKNRPNVVGSYYLKFEFSHEPLFVLTRHPDRDLKMTAWLTVLTSMFAMIMEAWPRGEFPSVMPVAGLERTGPTVEAVRPPVRPIVPAN